MSDKPQSDAPQQGALAQALQAAAVAAPDSALTSQIAAAAIEPPADDVDREPTAADQASAVDADAPAADGLSDAQRAANAATLAKVAVAAPATPAVAEPVVADAGEAGSEINDTADAPKDPEEPTVEQEPEAPADDEAPVADAITSATPVVKGRMEVATSLYSDEDSGYTQPEWFYTLTSGGQALKQAFDGYMQKMRPRLPVTDEEVARNQAVLARTFTGVINNLEGEDFQALFSHILAKFHEHKDGVFHPIKVNRGAELVALVPEDRRQFQRLVNMFGLLADPDGRTYAFKQVDLHKTLSGGITEAGRQKVFSYFNV